MLVLSSCLEEGGCQRTDCWLCWPSSSWTAKTSSEKPSQPPYLLFLSISPSLSRAFTMSDAPDIVRYTRPDLLSLSRSPKVVQAGTLQLSPPSDEPAGGPGVTMPRFKEWFG